MRNGVGQPLVSIVTPARNAGRFLDETIRSVLHQDYPHIEYVVMDGGSTDESPQILARYGDRLDYVSVPDDGQADAINRGFARTRGEILAFLNADDTYFPGAVAAVVRAFAEHPRAGVVYGDGLYVAEDGTPLAPYPVEPFDADHLARRCLVCQPAAFFRREAFLAVGGLDASLRFALDYDLWIRLAPRVPFVRINPRLATLRVHGQAKTMSEMEPAMRETIQVLRRHYGYVPFNWLYGYGHHRLTGEPVATTRPRAALASFAYSLALGVRYNWRHPLRYCLDIAATARLGLA